MSQFLFLFEGAQLDPDDGSPETREYMRRWNEWTEGLVARGALQSGRPLEWSGKRVAREGTEDLRLPPIDIGGYMIVQAASMEDAAALAEEAPNIALGGRILIRPCLDLPT